MDNNLHGDALLRLLSDYCAGRLSDADGRRLAAALHSDEAARRIFLEYMDLHSALTWETSSAADLEFVRPHRGEASRTADSTTLLSWMQGRLQAMVSTPQRSAWVIASLIFVAGLLVLAYTPLRTPTPSASRPPQITAEAPQPASNGRLVAARITGGADCQWDDSALPLGYESPLYVGQQVKLLEGTAEITFADGAVVTLGGPATLIVDSPSRGSLRQGELIAKIPKGAVGFGVQTPKAVVVDLGTEFGVLVADDGQEEVHVFSGAVEFSLAADSRSGNRLAGGEAIRLTRDGAKVRVERLAAAQRTRFPAKPADRGDTSLAKPLPQKSHPPVTDGLTLWLAADGAVRRDPENYVTVWEDMLTGDNQKAQNATQHAPQRRPRWIAQAIGGKPAVRFDGNDALLLSTPSYLGLLGEGYELFIVARTASPTIQFLIAGGFEDFELHVNGRAGARFIPAGYDRGRGASDLAKAGQFSDGQPHIFSARLLSDQEYRGLVAVDGVASGTPTRNDGRSKNNTTIRLGMRQNGTFPLRGEIAEVLIYRGSLTGTDRQAVGQYLAEKYAIALSQGDWQ